MKTFEEICRMSQSTLKAYMNDYLVSKGYEVVNENGFLYAKGDVPVLALAHLDTVHKAKCGEIHRINNRIDSPQGIGGDDRCGVFIIMNLIKDVHCSVLLCEDEESGGIGAREFTKATYTTEYKNGEVTEKKYIDNLDVNYMVEFDRKGNNDAVFYRCDNPDFTKFITETTGFKEEHGSFSDISVIAPAAQIAAVNLSSGYYNAHTTSEYVMYDEMMNTCEVAKKLFTTESDEFEFIEKKYTYNPHSYTGWDGFSNRNYYQQSFSDYMPDSKRRPYASVELELELEVVYIDEEGEEGIALVSGNTKAECWAKFFMENPSVCYDMIYDYTFA